VRTFFGQGISSDADVLTFWRKKLRIFRNLWRVRTDKVGGGLNHCGHFAEKGSQFFAILCERFLCTAPYITDTENSLHF